MTPNAARVRAARIILLKVVGTFGWLYFLGAAAGHIIAGWSAVEPPIYWLYDWHVYYVGANDFIDRDLYRGPLSLPGWPLPTPIFNQPSGAALLAIPLLPLGRELGGIVWLAIGLGALAFAAVLITRVVRIENGWAWAGLALAGYTGVYYFVGHVTLGNVNHIMLALLVGFVWAHLQGRQRLAGVLLGSAIAIKLWPLALAVVLARERRWQEIRWGTAVVAGQGVLVLLWLGPDVLPDIVDALRTDLPLGRDAVFMWTTWLREVVGFPPWFAPVLTLLLLLIPARGRLGLGIGMLAGLSLINNIWNHYLPTFAVAAILIVGGLVELGDAWERRRSGSDGAPRMALKSESHVTPPSSWPRTLAMLGGPAMIAASLILDVYAGSASHWSETLRPLLVTTAVSTLATLLVLVVTRRTDLASAIVIAAWAVVASGQWWLLAMVTSVATVGGVLVWERVTRQPMRWIASVIAVLPAVLLLVVLARLVVIGAIAQEDFSVRTAAAPRPSDTPRRSIYVGLLDGYPRSDSLENFGFDNREFLAKLESYGFEVYDSAESDYPRTELALAAMLWPSPPDALSEFVDPPSLLNARREVRRHQLAEAPGVDALAAAGYRTTYFPSQISQARLVGWANEVDTGHLSGFEVSLIQHSALAATLADWVMDQQRSRLDAALSQWADTSRESEGHPRAVFAHFMAPHVPYLYDRDGSPASMPACWLSGQCSLFDIGEMGLTQAAHSEAIAGQVTALNERLLSAVISLVDADPEALVVLLSDHGARYEPGITREWHASFLAARSPGTPHLFDADPGPNALFYRLLAASELQERADTSRTPGE